MERVEITEMPTKEVLENFLTSLVMGTTVEVYFDTEQGKFISHDDRILPADESEQPRCGFA